MASCAYLFNEMTLIWVEDNLYIYNIYEQK